MNHHLPALVTIDLGTESTESVAANIIKRETTLYFMCSYRVNSEANLLKGLKLSL